MISQKWVKKKMMIPTTPGLAESKGRPKRCCEGVHVEEIDEWVSSSKKRVKNKSTSRSAGRVWVKGSDAGAEQVSGSGKKTRAAGRKGGADRCRETRNRKNEAEESARESKQ
jgi:hypothetical protein